MTRIRKRIEHINWFLPLMVRALMEGAPKAGTVIRILKAERKKLARILDERPADADKLYRAHVRRMNEMVERFVYFRVWKS